MLQGVAKKREREAMTTHSELVFLFSHSDFLKTLTEPLKKRLLTSILSFHLHSPHSDHVCCDSSYSLMEGSRRTDMGIPYLLGLVFSFTPGLSQMG